MLYRKRAEVDEFVQAAAAQHPGANHDWMLKLRTMYNNLRNATEQPLPTNLADALGRAEGQQDADDEEAEVEDGTLVGTAHAETGWLPVWASACR